MDEIGDTFGMYPDGEDLPKLFRHAAFFVSEPLEGLSGEVVEYFDEEMQRLFVLGPSHIFELPG